MKKSINSKGNTKTACLIYPHQVFDPHPGVKGAHIIVFVEDPLFFSQYTFHRQKLMLHRASMKCLAAKLEKRGLAVHYLDSAMIQKSDAIGAHLKKWKVQKARWIDPCDDWLNKKVQSGISSSGIELETLQDPGFLTSIGQIDDFIVGKKKLFFTEFYVGQRKRLQILLEDGKPKGGKWSFDTENRKKLPKSVVLPEIAPLKLDAFAHEARTYVETQFPAALGEKSDLLYPWEHGQAQARLTEFVKTRLPSFGDYEDAITQRDAFLFHSVLTPMLNTGLILPEQVVKAALSQSKHVPMNSMEGFIRQVIGWREYIRLVYLTHGRKQRTENFWKMRRRLPKAFYDGTTGIVPVDHVIRSVLKYGYCHHIERLMILGNFMLLCGIAPDDIYQWFMEVFVDAYDWVMVPNVYGMSQHADGGFMTTKPYISGSAYVLKMSDFPKGDWCPVWDALYWRDKLGSKMETHRAIAKNFLKRLA